MYKSTVVQYSHVPVKPPVLTEWEIKTFHKSCINVPSSPVSKPHSASAQPWKDFVILAKGFF